MPDFNTSDDGLDDLLQLIEPNSSSEGAPATQEAASAEGTPARAAGGTPEDAAAELLEETQTAPPPASSSDSGGAEPAPTQTPPPPAPNTSSELLERLARAEATRQVAEDRARREAAAREQQEADARRAQLYDPAALELTEEERQTYAQSAPVIEKLVRAELQRYHAQTMMPELGRVNEVRQSVGQANEAARAALDRAVNATLRAAVPDLDTIARTPEWAAYLSSEMPELGAGVTRGSLLRTHLDNINTDAAISLIRGFKSPAAQAAAAAAPAAQRPAAPAPAPGRASGGAPASVAAAARGASGNQRRYAYSEYAKVADRASRGEVDMDKFDRLTEFFMAKMEEGLVDMNA